MSELFNRTTFFAYIRRAPFGNRLSQQQVDGTEKILSFWEKNHEEKDIRFLAYILATAFHETGGRMVPVREGFAKTDAGARKIVAKRVYGIEDPRTGHAYYGRGHVQLTWYANYEKFSKLLGIDLLNNPDLALDPEISLEILFEGMLEGKSGTGDYTGRSLERYFNDSKDDPEGARSIVNGGDKKVLIAGYHRQFLDALKEAAQKEISGKVEDADVIAAIPDGANLATDKTMIGALTTAGGGFAASLIAAISNPWAFAAFGVVAIGVFLVVTGRIEIKSKEGA